MDSVCEWNTRCKARTDSAQLPSRKQSRCQAVGEAARKWSWDTQGGPGAEPGLQPALHTNCLSSAAGENKSCISAANTHPQPLAPRRENHSGKTSSVDDNLSCRGSFVQTSQSRQIQQSPLSPPHPAPFVPCVFTIAPEDEAVVLN